ncbi:MAG TPA: acyl-CoA dehydrogenase family protein [Thermoleophilaceae bacterium]|nr:acyl-CoA dehydrogenase family protein [Thermoleophilaceae bacterium]
MNSLFGDTSSELVDTAARLGERELGRDLDAREDRGEFDADGWRRCASFGIQGLPMPEEYGGTGIDLTDAVRVLEALGQGCRDNGLLFALGAQMWSVQMPILSFGSDAQRERYLPALTAGRLIGAHCVTEPEAGSDAFSMRTTATAVDDGSSYVLNGRKTFITSAPLAGVFLVVATLDRQKGASGLTAFLVDRGTPGLDVEPLRDTKMGLRTSPMGDVVLQDCRVPAEQMLGTRGAGAAVFNVAMTWERCFILVPALGRMRRQLDDCIAYANTREQFGQAIGKNQAIADKIVDMHMRLEQSRLLAYRVAWMRERGERLTLEPSHVKLQISESWLQSSLDALQIHGGAGYLRGVGVEREVRDAAASRIYSGTSEMQRAIIARFIGL